jgi:hypothetical protein
MFISDFFTKAKTATLKWIQIFTNVFTNCAKLDPISSWFLHYYRIVLYDLLVWYYLTYVSFRFRLIELYYISS